MSAPVIGTAPTGQPCVSFVTITGPNIANSAAQLAAEQLGITLVARYGLCPNAVVPPALALNPAVLAEQFWDVIPLPVPKPTVPPGYALTGKPAYLVTGGTVAPAPATEQTALGPLEVVPVGQYYVQWMGSGVWQGPYAAEGQPWPNGVITHTYDDVGVYTVRVKELWTATWSLGPAHGALHQLETDAAIPGFPVRQIQAVITS